jgi:hypothetical protein
MRMSYPKLRVVIFLAGASFLSGIAVAQSYSGPKCLGPFCVDRKVSANMLVERLGPSISSRGTYGTKDRLAFLQIVGASKDEIGAVEPSDTSSLKSSEKELAKKQLMQRIAASTCSEDSDKAIHCPTQARSH